MINRGSNKDRTKGNVLYASPRRVRLRADLVS